MQLIIALSLHTIFVARNKQTNKQTNKQQQQKRVFTFASEEVANQKKIKETEKEIYKKKK